VLTSAHVGAMARTGTVASAANKLDETSAHVGAAARTGTVASAANKLDDAIVGTQAKEALIGLGWKASIAQAAVAAARGALGDATTLERLILEALRRCPRPGNLPRDRATARSSAPSEVRQAADKCPRVHNASRQVIEIPRRGSPGGDSC
jgi:hypothetical protein